MTQAKLDLKNRPDSGLLTFAQAHVAAMAGNASFTTPSPTVVSFAATLATYNTALTSAIDADAAAREATSAKNAARVSLETALTNRAGYVNDVSGGNETKILSAGFPVKSSAAPIGELPAPIDFLATMGDDAGEIDLIWSAVRGAKSYIIECRDYSPAGAWLQVKVVSRSQFTVPGLVPGKTYAFRVRAVGTAGESPWSDESVKMAA